MTSKDSSEQSRPLLTPDVVNPPPSIPQPTERYRDDVTTNDDVENYSRGDDDNGGAEFHINSIIVVRAIIVVFTFTNMVMQLVCNATIFASIMLIILSFFTFFWNLFAAIPCKLFQLCFGKGKNRSCQVPEFGIFVGEQTYYVTRGDSDDNDGRKKAIGASIIDFLLGLLILLFTVDCITNPGWYRRPYERSSEPIIALHFTIMALEFFVSAFQQIRGLRVFRFNVQASRVRNNYQYRIQLPQDAVASSSAKQPVSIVA